MTRAVQNNMKMNKGFTLIELLIVISIIGILAGVVIGVINPQRQQAIARDAVTQTTMNKFAEGIEAYYSANGTYPTQEMLASGNVSFIHVEAMPANLHYTQSGDTFYLCNVTAEDASVFFVYDSSASSLFRCGMGQEVTNCTGYGCE